MKKSLTFLFCLRLFFYLSVITLILIHPGVTVPFDSIGLIQWFLIVPLMAFLAFIPEKNIKFRTRAIISFVLLFLFSIIASGFNVSTLAPFAAGLVSFALTFLLFNRKPIFSRLAKIAVLEPFFLAWVCLRLLSLSRSGEDIAGQSVGLTQLILVWTAVVFLFHNAVIYLCLYPNSRIKSWKEGLVFFLTALALLFVVLFVLPADFVRNTVITNLTSERIPQKISQSDSDRGIPQRGTGRRTRPRNKDGNGELRGMSEHDWSDMGDGSGERRQYMVMIVASDREPVYMGNNFRGKLDPVKGFIANQNEPLNDLANQRFFVTWFSNDQEHDIGRGKQEVFSLSTLRQKYLPYRPISIDPVILSDDTGPLRYIHQVVSNTHLGDPLMLVHEKSRPFTAFEKSALAPYLEIPLEEDEKKLFEEYLHNAQLAWKTDKNNIIKNDPYLSNIFSNKNEQQEQKSGHEQLENIIAVLSSFSKYQYNLNPDDDSSIEALKNFITNSNEGDCVEFSNTLALLGRLAGIPSRVVTGYLAAESLQTEAHLRGLVALQRKLPILQQFPFDNLFMVTNLHSHSWTQFFIPDYGWLDFEATAFSMPPIGFGDFNNWDVVIPLFDEQKTFSQVKKFPWRAVGKALINLAILALICAYALRYGRELILYANSRNASRDIRNRTRSLYLLLLARLAADGQLIKPASKTAAEYSQLFKGKDDTECFKPFAEIYSELRWRQFDNPTEMETRFDALKSEYQKILTATRRPGLHRSFIRIISLRGLAYL